MLTAYNLRIVAFFIASPLLFYAFKPLIKGLKNSKKNNKKRKHFLYAISLIGLVPIVLLDLLFWFIFSIAPVFPHNNFDKDLWMKDVHQRYTMVDNLIDSKKLLGLTKNQVIILLGQPYNPYPQFGFLEDGVLYYDMSDYPTSGADSHILIINFQNDTVINYNLGET